MKAPAPLDLVTVLRLALTIFWRQFAPIILLGLVLMTIGLIEALRLPVTLCMLFAGIVLRNGERRAWVFPRHFGSVGGVLVIMLFLVAGMQIKVEHLFTGGFLALVLIGAQQERREGS